MKVAKASERDLEVAMDLCSALESLTGWCPRVPTAIEQAQDPEDGEHFDRDSREQCVRVLNYLLDVSERASVMRVVMGCMVMLDPANQCVDPDEDTIEHHPNTKAGMAAQNGRPLTEWTAEAGPVLWWTGAEGETPWLGRPTDEAWPGTHTHWTAFISPSSFS